MWLWINNVTNECQVEYLETCLMAAKQSEKLHWAFWVCLSLNPTGMETWMANCIWISACKHTSDCWNCVHEHSITAVLCNANSQEYPCTVHWAFCGFCEASLHTALKCTIAMFMNSISINFCLLIETFPLLHPPMYCSTLWLHYPFYSENWVLLLCDVVCCMKRKIGNHLKNIKFK